MFRQNNLDFIDFFKSLILHSSVPYPFTNCVLIITSVMQLCGTCKQQPVAEDEGWLALASLIYVAVDNPYGAWKTARWTFESYEGYMLLEMIRLFTAARFRN